MKRPHSLFPYLVILSTSLALLVGINPAFCDGPFFLDETVFGKFSKEDIELLKNALARANNSGEVNVPLDWKNPNTGNGGSVTVLEKKPAKDVPENCHRVKIKNYTQHQKGVATFFFCPTDDGTWKILK